MRLPSPLFTNKILLIAAVFSLSLCAVFAITHESTSPAPVATATPTPPQPAPVTATAPAPSDNATLVLELFNPSDSYLTHQLNETAISQQIEQVLSVSFVLTKCNIITETDYRDSFRALIMFAQKTKLAPDAVTAEAKVRQLAESAGASYALVYSRTKCDSPQLPTLKTQLLTWQNAMLGN